ncbi:uncharacterized protein LOC134674597 [Cydia fagiglandana]|uniref:uncharacterized protein LOC134674597 n=1 Tax=Cydia fagiglandana TaxID=1458189 RepID=UPI002FEE0327
MKYTCVLLCALLAVCVSGKELDLADIIKKECPPGERSVYRCPRMEQPDCQTPYPHAFRDLAIHPCFEADCFCELPTVRDRSTGKCVHLYQCPKYEKQ